MLALAPSAFAQNSDFSVSKSGPTTASQGTDVTFDVTVTNNGPDAGAVTMNDPVTGGWSFVSVIAPAGFSCLNPGVGATSGTVSCSNPSMPVGSAIINVTFHIPDNTPPNTSFTNTATVSSPTDTNNANNSGSATTSTPPSSDISVLKTGPSTADPDTDVAFTITVTNLGPNTAATVSLSDQVAGGWSFVSVTPGAGFTCTDPGAGATSGFVNCSASNMTVGSTSTFTIVFHIPADAPPGTSFVNVATVSSPSDFSSENNSSTAVTTTPPPPMGDVSIAKTGPSGAAPDSDVTYTITVTNAGPAAATKVSWTDTLPNGFPSSPMTFVSFTQTSGPAFDCGTLGTTTTCTIDPMPAGTTATFTFVGHIPSGTATGTTYTNDTTVTAANDPNGENNTASTSLIVQAADVGVTKSGPGTAIAGGPTYDYVIQLSNAGPDAATDASFLDPLPAGVNFVSLVQNNGPAASCNTPPPNSNGSVACTIAVLGNGMSAQFTITVQPSATITNGTVLNNTATASSTSADTNPANNSSSVATTVSAQADLSINKTTPATATAGGNISYAITVGNAGPSVATNAAWTDTLPSGTTFVSLTQNTGPTFTCTTGATVTCNIASLASGATATFTLVASASPSTTSGTTINNTATVSSSTPDSNSGNNSSTAPTTVNAQADLAITKTGAAAAGAGTNLSYTITVTNAGPSEASNVSWTDTLPPNTSFVSETQNSGPTFTCTTGATVTCNIASLAPGASATFTLTVLVSPSAPSGSTIANTANVSSSTADANSGNNSSTSTATVATSADLSVTKSGPAQTPSNTQVTYAVTVSNAGPSAAASVTLTDNVPANMTFASASQQSGPAFSCTTPPAGGTGAITCTIATFASGASASFQFVFNVPPGVAPGTPTTNTATVSATTPDANPANNSATVATTVAQSIPALSTVMLVLLALALLAIAFRSAAV